MGEEIAFENGRISDFQGLLTLTLDRVTLHTVMHHSSTSTYIPNVIDIEETFCGRTEGKGAVLGVRPNKTRCKFCRFGQEGEPCKSGGTDRDAVWG